MNTRIPFRLGVLAALVASVCAQADGSLTGLHELPGTLPINIGAVAFGISDDSNVLVGAVRLDAYNYRAYTFSSSGKTALVGPEGNEQVMAQAASGDGSVIVGWSKPTYSSAAGSALVWNDGTLTTLPDLNTSPSQYIPASSMAWAVSDDGTVVAGHSLTASGGWHAVRWLNAGAPQDLNGNGFTYSFTRDLDAAGSTVVGYGATASHTEEAFRWTEGTGMAGLGVLVDGTGAQSRANAVSADGNVVTGWSVSPTFNIEAFRWTQAGGMVGLGTLAGGTYSKANDINGDGSVIVGNADKPVVINGVTQAFNGGAAFRWQEGVGMQYLGDWLTANGVTVGSNTFSDAVGVDASGNVVVGSGLINGTTQIYIARVNAATGGGDTGGGDTGGGDTGGGTGGGTGVIGLDDFTQTLANMGFSLGSMAPNLATLTLFGAHHRLLVDNGLSSDNCLWATGDFGQSNGGDASKQLGEVGVCKDFGPVRLGAGVGVSGINQELTLGGESQFGGSHFIVEADYRLPDPKMVLSLTGYYGRWDADIRRNYLNGAAIDSSVGNTDAHAWAVRARFDYYGLATLRGMQLSSFVSYTHGRNHVDAYTETGGGFPIAVNDYDATSREARLGLTGKTALSSATDLLLSVEGIHSFDDAGMLTGTIVGVGAFGPLPGAQAPRNQARLGLELDHRVGRDLLLNASLHAADGDGEPAYSASLALRFGF